MKQVPFSRIFTVSLLVTGTTVGAGILALPVQTGLAGALPSLIAIVLIWVLMLLTGRILARRLIARRETVSDLGTLYEHELGPVWKWLAAGGYLLNFYGCIVAYLAGATSVLVALIPGHIPQLVWMAGFFVVATGLTLFGESLVRRGNAAIMTLLAVSFALLVVMAFGATDAVRFHHIDWEFLPSTLPIIACAFCYHLIIPTACQSLGWDFRSVWKALFIGTSFAFLMNVTWVLAAVGAIPLTGEGQANLVAAFEGNLPATIPLSLVLKSPLVTTLGMAFAFSAILTSYLGVGIALMGFIQDLASPLLGKDRRRTVAVLTFGPPLLVAVVYPNVFLVVLDIVGGVGVLLVFGILPCLVLIGSTRGKPAGRHILGYLMLAVFTLLMALELAQECGYLRVKPDMEYVPAQHVAQSATGP